MKQTQRLQLAFAALLATGLCLVPWQARGQDRLTQYSAGDNPLRPMESEALPAQIERLPDVSAQMKLVQRRSQLIITRNSVFRTAIADPRLVDVVQFSPNELAFIGLELGTTTVTLWFENNPEPLIYLVETIRDPNAEDRRRLDYGRLEQKLAVLFPNSKVYLIPMSRKVIVKGQARDAEESSRILQLIAGEVINQNGLLAGPGSGIGDPNIAGGLVGGVGGTGGFALDPTGALAAFNQASSMIVNMLDVPGENQVVLRVRIAELKRSMLRQLGINFQALINDSQRFLPAVITGSPSALTGIFDAGSITVLVNALENNGTAKILAEPTLTVLSGHPASFLSGGEFAVPTIVGIQGVGGQQTTFRGFGVSLTVVPTVIDRDLIRMQVLPEFSAIDQANSVNGVPGTNTRRVQTTVELREGQTIALAGLLSHQTSTNVTSFPVLGQIPIIGSLLFKNKVASQDETELLILVTPELVRPMEPDEVPPVPGFEVTHPNNCELYWWGMTEGAPDQNVYQLSPYGHGSGVGIPVGYSNFNPAPASPGYAPAATNPFGGSQAPLSNGSLGTSPYGANGGRYPIAPPPRRQQPGQGNGAPPNLGPIPNPNLPTSQPTAIGPSARRYGGHAAPPPQQSSDYETPSYTMPTGYNTSRRPRQPGY